MYRRRPFPGSPVTEQSVLFSLSSAERCESSANGGRSQARQSPSNPCLPLRPTRSPDSTDPEGEDSKGWPTDSSGWKSPIALQSSVQRFFKIMVFRTSSSQFVPRTLPTPLSTGGPPWIWLPPHYATPLGWITLVLQGPGHLTAATPELRAFKPKGTLGISPVSFSRLPKSVHHVATYMQ